LTSKIGARLRLAVLTVLALSVAPLAAAPTAFAAEDLLPDLKMSELYNMQIEPGGSGRYKLRFGTIVWNVGNGPLDVKAGNRIDDVMYDVAQVIHQRGGTTRNFTPPGATAFYAGDGHDHWHISTFIVISLYPTFEAGSTEQAGPTYNQRGLRKIGFCLTDLVRAPATLRPDNSANRIGFPVSGCGIQSSNEVRMGISVGYGDDYKPFFNHQSVDITGLPSGPYRMCATVNPTGVWLESDPEGVNNSSWVDLELDNETHRFRVTGSGETDCDKPAPMIYGIGG
jgi:hypothetical protein